MDVSEIDELDRIERDKDLFMALDGLSNGGGGVGDIDTSMRSSSARHEVANDGDGDDDSEDRSGATTTSRHSSGTVKSLVEEISRKNTENSSLKMQLNHFKLQVQALAKQERQSRGHIMVLQQEVANLEQDRALLEAANIDIATFEREFDGGYDALKSSGPQLGAVDRNAANSVRGELLEAANQHIQELHSALTEAEVKLSKNTEENRLALVNSQITVKSLRSETDRLSGELGTKTALFDLEKRQLVARMRGSDARVIELESVLKSTKESLSSLELRYTALDKERLEAQLVAKQNGESALRLGEQCRLQEARIETLEISLAEATSQARSAQLTVQRLKGSDLVDIEKDMAHELESIRAAARDREAELSRQLAVANESLSHETSRSVHLVNELETTKATLAVYHERSSMNLNLNGSLLGSGSSLSDTRLSLDGSLPGSLPSSAQRPMSVSTSLSLPRRSKDGLRGVGIVPGPLELTDRSLTRSLGSPGSNSLDSFKGHFDDSSQIHDHTRNNSHASSSGGLTPTSHNSRRSVKNRYESGANIDDDDDEAEAAVVEGGVRESLLLEGLEGGSGVGDRGGEGSDMESVSQGSDSLDENESGAAWLMETAGSATTGTKTGTGKNSNKKAPDSPPIVSFIDISQLASGHGRASELEGKGDFHL